jgi:hypothetical protein
MPKSLLIRHLDPAAITDGWYTAEIANYHPWTDHNTDKAAIYFRLLETPFEKIILLWYCPLLATRKNKTGRFLSALNIPLQHGQETDLSKLTGATLQILTWQTITEEGRTILITDMRPTPKGE